MNNPCLLDEVSFQRVDTAAVVDTPFREISPPSSVLENNEIEEREIFCPSNPTVLLRTPIPVHVLMPFLGRVCNTQICTCRRTPRRETATGTECYLVDYAAYKRAKLHGVLQPFLDTLRDDYYHASKQHLVDTRQMRGGDITFYGFMRTVRQCVRGSRPEGAIRIHSTDFVEGLGHTKTSSNSRRTTAKNWTDKTGLFLRSYHIDFSRLYTDW